jgi:cell division protease FtsH
MNPHAKHTPPPPWLSLACGSLHAVQHRKSPHQAHYDTQDDPLGELLGEPNHLPLMIDLVDEWHAQNGAPDSAFAAKRTDRIGTTFELLTILRLAATLQSHDAAYALCDPAAITLLDVGLSDWIQPASRAMQDLLPDHQLIYEAGERKKGDLLVLSPPIGDSMLAPKDAARFGKMIAEALEYEMPLLIVTAGYRTLPDAIKNVLPSPMRFAPLSADIVLALLHLRFADGDARHHAALRAILPADDMLARLGTEAIHAAFRAADGAASVKVLSEQAAAMLTTDGPTLDELDDSNPAVLAARQMVADVKLWQDGNLSWNDCTHSLLMHGQPGTGKTFLARAMARSSDLPLISTSIARLQSAGHLGDFTRSTNEVFVSAILAAPCILFIDEIDAAGSRSSVDRQGSNYWRVAITGLIEQIDLATRAGGVLIVGACNDISALDPAIIRPGRFDMIAEVTVPGRAGLTAMLQHQLSAEMSKTEISDIITAAIGQTPAVIDGAIRAARSSARSTQRPVRASDIVARLTTGTSLDRALTWRIALHECGHAIVGVDRILGTLRHVRLGPRNGDTRVDVDLGEGLPRDHKDMLAYTLGGRAAEAVILGTIGSGSGGNVPTCDLAFATRIALSMETSFGFGTSGLVWSPGDKGDPITDPVLREAVRARLSTADAAARNILEGHRVLLIEMAKDLMRHRILEGAALQIWIDRITGDAPWNPDDPSGRRAAAEDTAMVDSGTVIHLRDHRLDAPS